MIGVVSAVKPGPSFERSLGESRPSNLVIADLRSIVFYFFPRRRVPWLWTRCVFASQSSTYEVLACLMFGTILTIKGSVTKTNFLLRQSRQELCPLSAWSHKMNGYGPDS